MSDPISSRNGRRGPRPAPAFNDANNTAAYLMGKFEGIEDRFNEAQEQLARIGGQIDRMPEIVQASMKPLADQIAEGFRAQAQRIDAQAERINAHDSKINALELADATEKGSIAAISDTRTKVYSALGGLGAVGALLGGLYEFFRK